MRRGALDAAWMLSRPPRLFPLIITTKSTMERSGAPALVARMDARFRRAVMRDSFPNEGLQKPSKRPFAWAPVTLRRRVSSKTTAWALVPLVKYKRLTSGRLWTELEFDEGHLSLSLF